MADTTIPDNALGVFLDALDKANVRVAEQFPGDSPRRQPAHTIYGGAHLFKADLVRKLGAVALRTLREYAPDPAALSEALDIAPALADRIYPRIVEKLTREPIEDLRIDFEDGFGIRSDEEEDRFARQAADEVAAAMSAGTLPMGIGIRIKPLNDELKRRSLRTFDLFLTRLLDATGGTLPANFVVTLPKITAPEQVAAMASACDAFEYWRDIPRDQLRFELMVETTQAVFAQDGTVALPRLVAEGHGRIVAAHFGTYDYTAACSITAAHQHMGHPACDFAKHVMQVALAGTGIWLSDGATNIMPVAPHRDDSGGGPLTAAQRDENTRVVHRAWRLHAGHVRHSLVSGFYQGWDLHPGQLPTRYAALFAFFLEGLDAASDRLQRFVQKAAQATLAGDVFDDAATGQGLLNYFLRAMNCGAISEGEAIRESGLTLEELRGRSFVKILANRRARPAS
jgi:citrate lyase beta subunit